MATFDQLTDTPADKVGQDHRYVTVKVDESGLEYTRLLDAWGESSQSGLIKAGAFVDRPAAGFPERYYWAADLAMMFYDNGVSWGKVGVRSHNDLDNRDENDHHLAAHSHDGGFGDSGGIIDAGVITFTPSTLTDWDSDADPGDLDDALDQLAERVDDFEVMTTQGDLIRAGASGVPERVGIGAAGEIFKSDGTDADWVDDDYAIEFIIDGGGSVITTGEKGHVEVPTDGVIEGWTILADQSGSIVVDVWLEQYADFPPTVADTIAGSEKPTLSTAQKNQDLALTTWTTTVTKGDIIAFNVDSITTCQRALVSLRVRKT